MHVNHLGLLAFVAAAVSGVIAHLRPDLRHWWNGRWCFVLLLTAALFIFQRDAIRANFQLWNPDESQMIGGALTLQERPVFWRDVDGNSHGPLNQFPLLLPALFGFRVDYTSARIVSALMAVFMLFALHRTLALWFTEGTCRLLVLPAWALFIFNQDPETAQYTSELPSSLLVAIAAFLVCRALAGGQCSAWLASGIGLACGAAPLGKIQSIPIAAWVFLFMLVHLARQSRTTGNPPRRAILWLWVGALLPGVFFVGLAAVCGAFADFRIRFLEAYLLGYARGEIEFFNSAPPYPGLIFGFSEFLWPVATGLVIGAGWMVWRRIQCPRGFLILAAGMLAAALVSIYLPNKPYGHYFIFLPGPIILMLGSVCGPVMEDWRTRWTIRQRTMAIVAILLLLSGWPVLHHFQHPAYFRTVLTTRPLVSRAVISALEQRIHAGERLAIWGWQPALQVFTQTVSSTRDIIAFWPIAPSPWQEYYRATYLKDIMARPPVVFVDTTGPVDFVFHNAALYRHENFPALADYIADQYLLADTIDECRIYVRHDRVAPDQPAQ